MATARRLLLVDDDPLFLGVASDLLRTAGFEVRVAREPTRAVPEARAFSPHLILLDRVMPVLNGAEVVRSLRAFPDTAGIPVAFVTADHGERQLIRSVLGGAVDVILKPFGVEQTRRIAALMEDLASRAPQPGAAPEDVALRNLLGIFARSRRTGTLVVNPGTPFEGRAAFRDGQLTHAEFGPLRGPDAVKEMIGAEEGMWRFEEGPEAVAPARPPPLEVPSMPPATSELFRPRILVVDDDPELRRLFKMQLVKAGLEVVLAEDGLNGVELSTRSLYDLVIADLNMPRLDGWGMLKVLKADHRTREVPVVFLSAHDDYRETLRAARSGAADYLPKLGRADTVVQRVFALLQPRLELLGQVQSQRNAAINANQIGIQWTMRVLARLKATGVLTLRDDWATYTLRIREGNPVDAHALWPKREATGVSAVAALIVSRNSEGDFTFGDIPGDPARIQVGMETLIQRTCETLNQLESRVTASKLNTTGHFEIDTTLYELFRQVAPDTGLRLAKAVCEERLTPDELPLRLNLKPEEVQDGLKELLRRGVIRFPDPQ
ncbi:MAG: response regulator [Myxococcota bacterium]|nr:response regulator [Myxococcota bacterium]